MAAIDLKPIGPEEAVEFFRQKGFAFGFDHRDVWNQEHAGAFTVAKAMRIDILQDIRGAVDQALADGLSFEQFREQLQPTLESKGWWGRQTVTDPLTGEQVRAQLGSPRRLKIIYDVNLRTANAVGKWRRIERTKAARPWLRYVAVQDDRTRPEHMAWHTTVLPADHPWWRTHYPPNGWRCRCTVQQLSDADLQRIGDSPTVPAPPTDERPVLNKRSGKVEDVPLGIDPGFAHNPGRLGLTQRRASFVGKLDSALPELARPAVAAEVASARFSELVAGPGNRGPLPVAVLKPTQVAAIAARGKIVRFSDDTARKQAGRHPDLTPEDYGRVQRMLDTGPTVRRGDRTIIAVIEEDGRWFEAVVKATRDRTELYLTSYHRIYPARARRAGQRGDPIEGN